MTLDLNQINPKKQSASQIRTSVEHGTFQKNSRTEGIEVSVEKHEAFQEKNSRIVEKECEVCALPNRNEVEVSLMKGEALHREVAELYDIPIEVIRTHMKEHCQERSMVLSPEHQEKAKWLYGKAQQLSDLIDELFTVKLNAQGIKALVSALGELRQEIRMLAEIEGELAQKSSITVHQYNSLKMIVVGDLCGECKQKVLDKLEKMEGAS